MKNNLTKFIVAILILVAILLISYYFRAIIIYIAVATILSLLGEPIVNALNNVKIKNFRFNNTLSAFLTLLLLLLVFFGLLSALVPLFVSQAQSYMHLNPEVVLHNLTEPIMRSDFLYSRFHQYTEYETVQRYIQERLEQFFDFGRITQIFNTIAGLTGDIFLAIFSISFITFFFLRDRGIPHNTIMLLTPLKYSEKVAKSMSETKVLLTRYFIGVAIQILLVISLITLGLTIIGIKNAFFIGFLAGLLNIVPYLGPLIGAMLGILIALFAGLQFSPLSDLWPLMLKIAAVFGVVQLMDNFLFQPFIYSSSVKAHPLEIFLVILISGKIAGIPGIILAIPVYTIIRVIAKQFLSNFEAVRQLTAGIGKPPPPTD
jgi:predicted PurR-regulated permease PerM